MPITLRSIKGSPLTWNEMDGNFSDLADRTNEAWMMEGLEPTLRSGIGNPCELVTFIGNTVAYEFVAGSVMEAYVNWDVPFNWAPGTDVYAAIHWSPGVSTNTGDVRWGLEFVGAAVNDTFPLTPNFSYAVGTTDGTAWKHIQTISDPYPEMFVSPNKRFLIRVFRDGGNVEDTFPDSAYMVGVDFYYRVNKFGTPSFTPPYT